MLSVKCIPSEKTKRPLWKCLMSFFLKEQRHLHLYLLSETLQATTSHVNAFLLYSSSCIIRENQNYTECTVNDRQAKRDTNGNVATKFQQTFGTEKVPACIWLYLFGLKLINTCCQVYIFIKSNCDSVGSNLLKGNGGSRIRTAGVTSCTRHSKVLSGEQHCLEHACLKR